MQVFEGRTYYQKDEFEKELIYRFISKGKELGILKPGKCLTSTPPIDIIGEPIGIRMYALDGIPIFNTSVNEHGFYFMKPVTTNNNGNDNQNENE